ncbi:ABC transporter permease subunit [Chitinimonas taiwanensis]|jgi:putrescine transport system permease protein|uniref:Putrescine transport system permease protein n=1 Tax=Chitinimonas taiwanensis DSM 18899 TaxID=1121279 RepID=A0A1K2HIQ0_9NEIS|nr:ABC transporter permease subunit [Chitinimonas taiwanensis]SFZ76728.1 putrescine transport system permease protein [Chitinimonas taiwanensis DSM 18899]
MKKWLSKFLPGGRSGVIAVPYLWLLFFFVLPFFFVLKISFAEPDISQPPYTPLMTHEDSKTTITLNTSKYTTILDEVKSFGTTSWSEAAEQSQYVIAYWNAIKLAFFTMVFTLLIGYPLAYNIARASEATRNTLLMLVMIPFWTSFLLRVYAWIGILKDNGIINNLLLGMGLIDAPLQMLYTPFSVLIGMVYNYLPFMILPLYAHLTKLDSRLFEAAADLGASKWTTFFQITLPLSKAGIIAGCMMVFIPAVGEYVIPALLGGGDVVFIGNKLMDDFGPNLDWPQASAVAVVMLALLIAPIVWFQRFEQKQQEAA